MGKGGKVTVGYRYHLGMHIVVAESPIDGLLEVKFGDRTAWAGKRASGRIQISRGNLFGGKSREGGVSGFVDVLDGSSSQSANDYLQSRLGGLVPAFRGVFSLVFRRFYFGNNPYIKPIRLKAYSIFQTFGNWLPNLAPIGYEVNPERLSLYIAIDQSGSMQGLKQATLVSALTQLLNSLPVTPTLSIRIQRWGLTSLSGSEVFGFDEAARAQLLNFVASLGVPNSAGTEFDTAFEEAAAFFAEADSEIVIDEGFQDKDGASSGGSSVGSSRSSEPLRRVIVFLTDGAPGVGSLERAIDDLAALDYDELIGINIEDDDTSSTVQLDSDGIVPVIDSNSTDQLAQAIGAGFSSFVDINPAHILRDLLVNPENGGTGNAADIGDSFEQAAAQLFAEGLGLSFHWKSRGDVDAFKRLVERHIDASVYEDPISGKYEIKLIRPDYTVGSLFAFSDAQIVDWLEWSKPEPAEIPNQITIEYTRRDTGEPGGVTVTNVAAVQVVGAVKNERVEYEGVTRQAVAAKLAERDLVARTQPIIRGAFRATYVPTGVNLGSAVLVPDRPGGTGQIVVRVTEIEETDGRDNSAIVRFAQDVWSTDLELDPVTEEEGVEPESFAALPPNVVLAEEIPYLYLVRLLGEAEVTAQLVEDPDLGYWHATCDEPSTVHISALVVRNDAGTWLEAAEAQLAPTWRLTSALSRSASAATFTALENGREGEIEVGDILQIDGEMMRVDSIAIANGVATFTVGRGILDTVPAPHDLGAYAIAWDGFTGSDFVRYTAGEDVLVRTLPRTPTEVAALGAVATETIGMSSRAIRPYPAGKLQIDGEYLPTSIKAGLVSATWAHRDRIDQTTETIADHTADSIGPEDGVSYVAVRRERYLLDDLFALGDVFAPADFFMDDTPGAEIDEAISPASGTAHDFDVDAVSPGYGDDVIAIELGVRAVRGMDSPPLENWQTPFVLVRPLLAPINLTATVEGLPGGGGGSGSGSGSA